RRNRAHPCIFLSNHPPPAAIGMGPTLVAVAALFSPEERALAQDLVHAGFSNPFAPETLLAVGPSGRHAPERSALAEKPALASTTVTASLRPVLDAARERLAAGPAPADADRALYEDACLHLLLDTHGERLR